MRARIFCKVGDLKGLSFDFAEEATIGRSPDCAVVLPVDLISGRHARIFYDAQRAAYMLEDLDSLNGTELDGMAVHGPERLDRLHVVGFARHELIFQRLDGATDAAAAVDSTAVDNDFVAVPAVAAAEPTEEADGTRIESDPLALPSWLRQRRETSPGAAGSQPPSPADEDGTRIEKGLPALPEILVRQGEPAADAQRETFDLAEVDSGAVAAVPSQPPPMAHRQAVAPADSSAVGKSFCLEVAESSGEMRRYPLRSGDNLIGREAEARVRLDRLDLSRRHATLIVVAGRVIVRDEGSRNHTYLEEAQIDTETEVPVGARLRFGGVEARLVEEPSESTPRKEDL